MKYDITVNPVKENEHNIKAMATVTLGNAFVIRGIKIIEGKNGDFLSFPNYKKKAVDENGQAQYQDVCYPVTKEFREELQTAIMDAYNGKNEPEITAVKVTALDGDNSLKGLATVTLDGAFAISGIKINEGSNGLFVAMPSYSKGTGNDKEFKDVCNPITASFREKIVNSVMDEYQRQREIEEVDKSQNQEKSRSEEDSELGPQRPSHKKSR